MRFVHTFFKKSLNKDKEVRLARFVHNVKKPLLTRNG